MRIPELDELRKRRAELEQLGDLWKRVSETKVPDSLSEALESEWVLEFSEFNIGHKLGYEREEKRDDRKRVVRASVVLSILSEMEAKLVEDAITQPVQGFAKKLRLIAKIADALYNYGPTIFRVLWIAVKKLAGDLWDDLLLLFTDPERAIAEAQAEFHRVFAVLAGVSIGMVLVVLEELTKAFSVKSFVVQTVAALKARDAAEKKLRTKFLPQSTATRYRRRKETAK